jgi:hypothetical protein
MATRQGSEFASRPERSSGMRNCLQARDDSSGAAVMLMERHVAFAGLYGRAKQTTMVTKVMLWEDVASLTCLTHRVTPAGKLSAILWTSVC